MDATTALAFEVLSAHADLLRREKLLQLAKKQRGRARKNTFNHPPAFPARVYQQGFANPEEALQLALAHNPRLSVSRSSISLSQQEHNLAKSRYLPNLSAQASYNVRYQKGKT